MISRRGSRLSTIFNEARTYLVFGSDFSLCHINKGDTYLVWWNHYMNHNEIWAKHNRAQKHLFILGIPILASVYLYIETSPCGRVIYTIARGTLIGRLLTRGPVRFLGTCNPFAILRHRRKICSDSNCIGHAMTCCLKISWFIISCVSCYPLRSMSQSIFQKSPLKFIEK